MNKTIRLFVFICLVVGIVFVAQGKVAWATQSSDPSLSASSEKEQSFLPAKDIDCTKDNNKNKDKCKGTVKPPPSEIIIPVTGEYSVGGFCTIDTILNDPKVSLQAVIQTPLIRDLPDKVHKVRQGCLLTYYASSQRMDELTPLLGNTTICFAATGQKDMTIYFYNMYDANPTWVALPTNVQNNIACAAANHSGVYVATFQTP